MAKLILRNSLEAQMDISDAAATGGVTYTDLVVDTNIGQNGGSYETTYTHDKAIKYVGVVDELSAAALTDGLVAFEGTATTTGTEPGASGVKAFYVKYDSTLGTVASVTVTYLAQPMAILGVGESVLRPLSAGVLANCKIHTSAFGNGSHEATVTVVLIGD